MGPQKTPSVWRREFRRRWARRVVVASLALGVRIDRTFVGDLVVRLTYTPSAGAPVSFDIMNRVGRMTSGFGDDSNPNAENLMIFSDLAATDLWAWRRVCATTA
ncbi:MAG: hypothetical protein ACREJO_18695 [Phycisphaerales bacterium]